MRYTDVGEVGMVFVNQCLSADISMARKNISGIDRTDKAARRSVRSSSGSARARRASLEIL